MGWIVDGILTALFGAFFDFVFRPPLLPGDRVPYLRGIVIVRLLLTAAPFALTALWIWVCAGADATPEAVVVAVVFLIGPSLFIGLVSLVIARGLAHERVWAAWFGLICDFLFVTALLSHAAGGAAYLVVLVAPVAVEVYYLCKVISSGELN